MEGVDGMEEAEATEATERRMTPEEMQRFLNQEARDGVSEIVAYRRLAYILGIEWPDLAGDRHRA